MGEKKETLLVSFLPTHLPQITCCDDDFVGFSEVKGSCFTNSRGRPAKEECRLIFLHGKFQGFPPYLPICLQCDEDFWLPGRGFIAFSVLHKGKKTSNLLTKMEW